MAPKKEDLYTKALASRNLFVADIINICTTVMDSLVEDPIDAEATEENYAIWLDKWQRLDKIQKYLEEYDLHPVDAATEVECEKAREQCIRTKSRYSTYVKKETQ